MSNNIVDGQREYDLNKPIVQPIAQQNPNIASQAQNPTLRNVFATDANGQRRNIHQYTPQETAGMKESASNPMNSPAYEQSMRDAQMAQAVGYNMAKRNTEKQNAVVQKNYENGQKIGNNTDYVPYVPNGNELTEKERNLFTTNVPTKEQYNAEHPIDEKKVADNATLLADRWQKQKDAEAEIARANKPLTYADFRDAMYGPEAEREKRANRQAKIQAVGDALRHIGNLATTIGSDKMGRAIPQQFKTSPAQQTLAEYKAERKERDAMGYQQLLQHQKQKQQEYENQLKAQEAARKNMSAQYDWAHKDAQTKQILQNMQFDAQKYPFEYQKLVGDAATALANGKIKEYDAAIKQLEYANTPTSIELANKLAKAKIAHENASTNAANASARNSNESAALTALKRKELKEKIDKGDGFDLPMNNEKTVWRVDKRNSTALGNVLRGIVKKHPDWNDSSDNNSMISSNSNKLTASDLLTIAYSHIDDDEIQKAISKYGKIVDVATDPYSIDGR